MMTEPRDGGVGGLEQQCFKLFIELYNYIWYKQFAVMVTGYCYWPFFINSARTKKVKD